MDSTPYGVQITAQLDWACRPGLMWSPGYLASVGPEWPQAVRFSAPVPPALLPGHAGSTGPRLSCGPTFGHSTISYASIPLLLAASIYRSFPRDYQVPSLHYHCTATAWGSPYPVNWLSAPSFSIILHHRFCGMTQEGVSPFNSSTCIFSPNRPASPALFFAPKPT